MNDKRHLIDHRPMVVVILDGWGYSEDAECNAIHAARKPTWDELWRDFPHTLLRGSGTDVGLPAEQMGNSEVGHLNLGAGRVVRQELSRIERAITDGEFYANEVLLAALDEACRTGKAVHVLGLLSPGGVHSHEAQIHALLRLAVERGAPQVYLHAFLDGRDTPPRSAHASLVAAEGLFRELGRGAIASVVGRYYAMDRDQRWARTQAAFELVCRGAAEYRAADGAAALAAAYARGESDEFVKPTAIVSAGGRAVAVADGDVIVFMNFRADRARQMTRCFVDQEFAAFARGPVPRLGGFVSLTEYQKDLDVAVAFRPLHLKNVFGEYIAALGLRQLRIAETEKYAHVTFFFNGGEERQFAGEERILIPSPKVATYDLQPEMCAPQLTDRLIEEIESGRFDVIICNYANPDMVGHTGVFPAAVRAIEVIDACLGRIRTAVRRAGGELVITADHGNAEQMCDRATGQPHTAHTSNLVPLIYVGRPARLAGGGALSDVAPTLLRIMGLERPSEMSGRVLVELVGP